MTRRDDLDLVTAAQCRLNAQALRDKITVARGRYAHAVKAQLLDKIGEGRGRRSDLLAVNEDLAR